MEYFYCLLRNKNSSIPACPRLYELRHPLHWYECLVLVRVCSDLSASDAIDVFGLAIEILRTFFLFGILHIIAVIMHWILSSSLVLR